MKWIAEIERKSFFVDGPKIKPRVQKVANEMKIEDPNFSEGLLWRFKKLNYLRYKLILHFIR